MILYPPPTENHKKLIAKENSFQPEYFDVLQPFDFLFLDKKTKSTRKNFDEKI